MAVDDRDTTTLWPASDTAHRNADERTDGENLRPVHYLGNKSKYLTEIVDTVNSLTPDGSTVMDLFAGTGVVSRALAASHPVVPVDVQAYSATFSKALCSPVNYSNESRRAIVEAAKLWMDNLPQPFARLMTIESDFERSAANDPSYFISLTEEGSLINPAATNKNLAAAKAAVGPHLRSAGTTITAYYGGVYFSYRQALELDAIRHVIGHQPGSNTEPTLVAALLGAASDVVATVGAHFAQPMRLRARDGQAKNSAVAKSLRSRQRSVFNSYEQWLRKYGRIVPSDYSCRPVTADYRTVLENLSPEIQTIYADPPYTRDHYSRFYHVLETLALSDDPGVSVVPGTKTPSRGLYRLQRHQSPFSIRTQATEAFDTLFKAGQQYNVPLVLSYSPQGGGTSARPETRLLSIEQIVGLAKQRFRTVEIATIDSSTHSRFNRTALHGTVPSNAEVLIIARP